MLNCCVISLYSCDIHEMYQEILIQLDDHSYKLILLRELIEPIPTFQLNTVIYDRNTFPV